MGKLGIRDDIDIKHALEILRQHFKNKLVRTHYLIRYEVYLFCADSIRSSLKLAIPTFRRALWNVNQNWRYN